MLRIRTVKQTNIHQKQFSLSKCTRQGMQSTNLICYGYTSKSITHWKASKNIFTKYPRRKKNVTTCTKVGRFLLPVEWCSRGTRPWRGEEVAAQMWETRRGILPSETILLHVLTTVRRDLFRLRSLDVFVCPTMLTIDIKNIKRTLLNIWKKLREGIILKGSLIDFL